MTVRSFPIAAALLILGVSACFHARPVGLRDVADLDQAARDKLAAYLDQHSVPPVDFLVTQCKAHDLVMVGEAHHVRENCQLIADALAPLHAQADLRWFCTEFLRRSQTERANEIVTAATYDEEAVAELYRNGPWPTWGFKDYMDILRAVWQVNHDRPPGGGAPPLRIQGIDSDWSQHDLWFGKRSKIDEFKMRMDREKAMTAAIEEGPLAQDGKALLHVGFAHSVKTQGARMATVLHQKYGDRIYQVVLHQPLPGKSGPSDLTKLIEQLSESRPDPWAMEIHGSPFETLTDRGCEVLKLLPNSTVGEMAQSYVFLAPATQLSPMRWHPGFVKPEHFQQTLDVAVKLGYVKEGECADAACLDAKLVARFPPG
jgi:hypothetical protein